MATRKNTTPDYDFDGWDEAAEESAIANLAPDVKHIIVEGDFVGRYSNGDTIRLSLSLPLDTILDLESTDGGEIAQFKKLIASIGNDADIATFGRHGFTDSLALATRYFEVLERIAGASLGK